MKKIGRYEVQQELGRGPLGVVYLAHDPQKERDVRIKTLLSPRIGPEAAQRFLQCAKRSGTLKHDGVARVFAVGEVAGKPFVTGEPLPETIADVIARRDPISLRSRIQLVVEVASALAAAHAQGLLHTGIKAGNVGMRDGRPVLLDFGSGFALQGIGAESTRSGPVLDGIRYMAPEVLEGQAPTEPSDVYALGVLLYEVLSYERPFAATSIAAIVKKIVNQQIRALTQIDPAFPPSLDAVLARSLARPNEGRYRSVTDLVHDLERVAQSLPAVRESARPLPAAPVPPPSKSREELAARLAAMVLEARQRFQAGDKERCQSLMMEVDAYTSDEAAYPGLDDMVRKQVDALAHGSTPTPISPRGVSPDHYAQAHSLFTAGDHAACLAALQDLFAQSPDHQQGRMLALAAEKALRGLTAQGKAPRDPEQARSQAAALLHVGRTALSRGDLQVAETVQRALEGVSPDGTELKEIRSSLSEARLAALRSLPAEPPRIEDQAATSPGKSGELRARLRAWLQSAQERLDDGQHLEALALAYEVVKVDPSRLEALTLMERCVAELKTRARERTLVSVEIDGKAPARRRKDG